MRTLVLFVVLILSPVLAHAADLSKVRASSVVLLAEPRLPPPGVVRERLEQRLKGRLKVDAMEADGAKVVLFRLRGGTVAIGLIESPLPKGQIDDLCAGAWHWKAACEATASHRGHVFITVLDTDLDTLDASLLLTDVVAALMDSNAIASYWGASLQSRDAFLKQSADVGREQPPVWLWVNFRISNDIEKGFSLSTQGMEAFGLREIEAKDVQPAARHGAIPDPEGTGHQGRRDHRRIARTEHPGAPGTVVLARGRDGLPGDLPEGLRPWCPCARTPPPCSATCAPAVFAPGSCRMGRGRCCNCIRPPAS
jgi:hypothetical protein